MKRIKITQEQMSKIKATLNESKDVKGGLNRVSQVTKAEFSKLGEDSVGLVKNGLQSIASAPTQNHKEVPIPKHVNEDIFSPELHKAIHSLIEHIWANPSHKGLDPIFQRYHISWGDIMLYLTGEGIAVGIGAGAYKIKNFFKRKFNPDPNQALKEKKEEIDKIVSKIEKDPKAPWSANVLKDPNGQQTATAGQPEMDENYYTAEPHPDSPDANRVQKDPAIQRNTHQQAFQPLALGGEIAVLQGPDGKYIFNFDNMRRDDFPNPQYNLTAEDVADYVNDNLDSISKGVGLQDFERADLVKMDDALKTELMDLYSKDNNLLQGLHNLEETTGAASSGAFVAPLGTPIKRDIEEVVVDEEPIEEVTSAASSGQYVQPKIWAKTKEDWAGAKKTQYPEGEMVSFDKCTSYNNNKEAENGKCSQGAIDNVVKTHKTKGSVISKSMYEQIAAKTGRKVEEIQELIESKFGKNNSL